MKKKLLKLNKKRIELFKDYKKKYKKNLIKICKLMKLIDILEIKSQNSLIVVKEELVKLIGDKIKNGNIFDKLI